MLYKDLTPDQKAELKELINENAKLKSLMEQYNKRSNNFQTSLGVNYGAYLYFRTQAKKEMIKERLTNVG